MLNRLLIMAVIGGQSYTCAIAADVPPPAQGPPAVTAGFQSFSVQGFLTPQVRSRIDSEIATLNTQLAARTDVRARLSVSNFTAYSPWPTQTKFLDRPNHWYMKVVHMLEVTVSDIQWKSGTVNCSTMPQYPGCPAANGKILWNNYPWSRKLSVSIAANTYCDGWETGSGNIKIVGVSDPPYLDPSPGTVEAIVDFFLGGALVDLVNAKITAALHGSDGSAVVTNWACRSLGGLAGQNGQDDEIRWNVPTVVRVDPYPITYRPIRIKRLVAHKLDGGILYNAEESPVVQLWGGFGSWSGQMPVMLEGQTVSISAPDIRAFPHPTSANPLLVIASISDFDGHQDSSFKLFPSSTNYGAGTQTVTVSKGYWRPPVPPLTKPIHDWVPAYEITFVVTVPQPAPIDYGR